MSGSRRSHMFFALGSTAIAVACPIVITIAGYGVGFGEMTEPAALGRMAVSLGLFLVHFIALVGGILLIALLARDSGKTIIISVVIGLLASILASMQPLPGAVQTLYEYTLFYHLADSLRLSLSSADVAASLSVAAGTILIFIFCGRAALNKMEL